MNDKLKSHLSKLTALSAKTEAAERKILAGAESRLEVVNDRIDDLKPAAITSAADGKEYQELILERGRLELVIAQAGKIINE